MAGRTISCLRDIFTLVLVLKYVCMFTNARSLTGKMGELQVLALEQKYVIGVAETWLNESHDWAVDIGGYTLFRRDRGNRKGGGMYLFVKQELKANIKEEAIMSGIAGSRTLDFRLDCRCTCLLSHRRLCGGLLPF
ncbi:hypothetical protein XENTR_v10024255 [Xenopus tropicalis]|nr:hypothetical protein XENTR_v10024255 [Xenopus tropicalis]